MLKLPLNVPSGFSWRKLSKTTESIFSSALSEAWRASAGVSRWPWLEKGPVR